MKVCVFGSSSNATPQKYLDESFQLGKLIADNGFVCVNGGGMFGVMGMLLHYLYSNNFSIFDI